jgi:hypothetical protein
MPDDDEVRARWGENAAISRKGDFILVHLDGPGEDIVRRRTEDFDPDDYFDDDCPLCQIQRAGRVFVFDDYPEDADEWAPLE